MQSSIIRILSFMFVSIAPFLTACAVSPTIPKNSKGSITEVSIPAPSLAGNRLGDPDKQPVAIYLPPDYDLYPEKRFPVLYLLHGFTGTQQTWLIDPDAPKVKPLSNGGYQHAGMLKADMLDRRFGPENLDDFIIVAPNGRNAFKHSFYVNSPVTGNWEDYVAEDVVRFVDANYRTLQHRDSRGIAGHSGGGNGALILAMKYEDVFGSVYAMAPCCLGSMYSLPPFLSEDTGNLAPLWQSVYSNIASVNSLDDLPEVFTPDMKNFYTNAEFAAAAAYAPNPERTLILGDPLYELKGGQLVRNDKAIDKRLAQSAFHQVKDNIEELKSLRGIFIDYGELEWEELSAGNAEFTQALAKYRIPFRLEVYQGGDHGNLIHKRMETHGLAFFAETLAFSPE